MTRPTLILILTFLFFIGTHAQHRSYKTLQKDWAFKKGEVKNAHLIDFNDNDWEKIDLPHDWAIKGPFIVDGDGSTGKLPWKGEGWYRYKFKATEDLSNKTTYLIFDGVMAFPEVYVNGQLAGKWDYGYNSFYIDVSSFLKSKSNNTIVVHADTRKHDSRWYPGAGIYRKVQILHVDQIHSEIWGTFITSPVVKKTYSTVRIQNSIINNSNKPQKILIENIIFDPNGNEIASDTVSGSVLANKSALFEMDITVTYPELWDIENPALYKCRTQITQNGKACDISDEIFGIRTIKFTANDGFHLNGKRVQLKGVNLHHDHGALGAAFYPRAMERQLEIMKSMGANAIRNSHNTSAPELLEMCDRMGLLFFNEVFDKYDKKADILDSADFESFTQRNIENFVKRDRNHPSVFIWSVGNEIGDVQWNVDNGFHKLHTMINYVRKYDPTRPTTLVCDAMESAEKRHFDYYDVHSWNYGRRYSLARKLEPEKSVIISESASTLSTRGFYELPLPEDKTSVTKSLQVSSYDLNAPWWAEIADDDFMWQEQEPYVAGEFVWTGFDYLGEPTPYYNSAVKEMGMTDNEASRSSYFGIVDLMGIPKDRYYLYKSHWMPEEKTIHILPHWNWENSEFDIIPVFVYTNGDCAELFLNEKSLGKKCKDQDSEISVERYRLMWKDIKYEKGTLKAIAYKNGKQIGSQILKTASEASSIKLTADNLDLKSNGQDLSYILIEALDKNGNTNPLAMDRLNIELSGVGKIVGIGNGNPQNFNSFNSDFVDLFYGKAMIIFQSGHKSGKAKMSISSDKFKTQSISISVN